MRSRKHQKPKADRNASDCLNFMKAGREKCCHLLCNNIHHYAITLENNSRRKTYWSFSFMSETTFQPLTQSLILHYALYGALSLPFKIFACRRKKSKSNQQRCSVLPLGREFPSFGTFQPLEGNEKEMKIGKKKKEIWEIWGKWRKSLRCINKNY